MSRALVILLGAQLAIGAAAIFARFALTGTGPITASALRLVIAAAIASSVAGFARERIAIAPRDGRRLVWAGIALGVHFATWLASLRFTTVAISTLIVTTTPLWLGLYDALVMHHRVRPAFWFAMALGAGGLVVAVTGRGFGAGPNPPLGVALALAGSVAIGVYLTLVRDIGTAYATRTIVARTYAWGALVLVAAMSVAREPFPTTVESWGGILAMALVSQALGHTAMNAALRSFPPRIVAATTLAEPVIAAALAWLIFSEALSALQVMGACVVLAAVAYVLRDDARDISPA